MEPAVVALTPEDFVVLREELVLSSKARDRAQSILILFQLTLCLLFVAAMWNATSSFLHRGLAPTGTVLSGYLQRSSGRYMMQLEAAAKRALPKVSAALSEEFSRRLPELERHAVHERARLVRTLHNQMPRVDAEFGKLVAEQRNIVEQEFGVKVGPDRARRMADAYQIAFPEQAREMGQKLFGRHVVALEKLHTSAQKLAGREHDLVSPSDPVEALGLTLELAGLEVQEQVGNFPNDETR